MATKTYHIMDKEEWKAVAKWFHPEHASHYIDLPNGRILVAAHFASEWAEEMFAENTPSRDSLPNHNHWWEGTQKISESHVEALHAHPGLFPEHAHPEAKKAAARQCTTRDIVQRACKVNKLLRLSVL